MVGEVLVGIEFREIPAGGVAVDPVVERRIVAHLFGKGAE